MVFRNERDEAETAICAERDAKGMTCTPQGFVRFVRAVSP
jgi:hypothetical protein